MCSGLVWDASCNKFAGHGRTATGEGGMRRRAIAPDCLRCTLRRVTVCLAAYSVFHRAIVTISDTMLSNSGLAADGAGFKSAPLNKTGSWFALYSGYPEEFAALTRRIRTELSGTDAPSLDDVLAATSRAYAVELVRIGDMRHLAPLGMTRDSFYARRELIGEAAFARVFEALAAVRLSTELLICGFDEDGGHIASTKPDGVYEIHDSVGFHAIGEGAWLALGVLYAEPKFQYGPLESIVYELCGAKFAAERAPSVGTETIVLVRRDDNKIAMLFDKTWRSHARSGPPRRSDGR